MHHMRDCTVEREGMSSDLSERYNPEPVLVSTETHNQCGNRLTKSQTGREARSEAAAKQSPLAEEADVRSSAGSTRSG